MSIVSPSLSSSTSPYDIKNANKKSNMNGNMEPVSSPCTMPHFTFCMDNVEMRLEPKQHGSGVIVQQMSAQHYVLGLQGFGTLYVSRLGQQQQQSQPKPQQQTPISATEQIKKAAPLTPENFQPTNNCPKRQTNGEPSLQNAVTPQPSNISTANNNEADSKAATTAATKRPDSSPRSSPLAIAAGNDDSSVLSPLAKTPNSASAPSKETKPPTPTNKQQKSGAKKGQDGTDKRGENFNTDKKKLATTPARDKSPKPTSAASRKSSLEKLSTPGRNEAARNRYSVIEDTPSSPSSSSSASPPPSPVRKPPSKMQRTLTNNFITTNNNTNKNNNKRKSGVLLRQQELAFQRIVKSSKRPRTGDRPTSSSEGPSVGGGKSNKNQATSAKKKSSGGSGRWYGRLENDMFHDKDGDDEDDENNFDSDEDNAVTKSPTFSRNRRRRSNNKDQAEETAPRKGREDSHKSSRTSAAPKSTKASGTRSRFFPHDSDSSSSGSSDEEEVREPIRPNRMRRQVQPQASKRRIHTKQKQQPKRRIDRDGTPVPSLDARSKQHDEMPLDSTTAKSVPADSGKKSLGKAKEDREALKKRNDEKDEDQEIDDDITQWSLPAHMRSTQQPGKMASSPRDTANQTKPKQQMAQPDEASVANESNQKGAATKSGSECESPPQPTINEAKKPPSTAKTQTTEDKVKAIVQGEELDPIVDATQDNTSLISSDHEEDNISATDDIVDIDREEQQDTEMEKDLDMPTQVQTQSLSQYYELVPQSPSSNERHRPSPRWGHAMTSIGDNKFLVYGGQGDDPATNDPTVFGNVAIFNAKKQEWNVPVNCEGDERQWHTATYIPNRKQVISIGGERKHGETVRKVDSIRMFDTEISLWYDASCAGNGPRGRSGHSSTLLETRRNELVMYGGIRGTSSWANVVNVLDTERWMWTNPKIKGDPPRPRSYHTATAVPQANGKDWIVVFGGNNAKECFSSVHCLERLETESGSVEWTWIHPIASGTIPTARTGHSATLLADKKTILIYGGWDPRDDDEDQDFVFGDSYLLDTETWTWRKHEGKPEFISGSQDFGPARMGHGSVLNGKDEILIFGGRRLDCYCDDLQRLKINLS